MKDTIARFGASLSILAFALVGAGVPASEEVQAVAQNMPGFKAQMQYQDLGNGESVNLANGGLIVSHASAIHLPGNMGSDLRPVQVYNSKSVVDGFDDIVCPVYADQDYGPLGYGWHLGFGRVLMRHERKFTGEIGGGSGGYQCADFFYYYYEDESGAQHHLYPIGGFTYTEATHSPAPVWYVTNDGSYIRAKYQSSIAQWVLYFPDGSVRRAGDPAKNGLVEPDLAWGTWAPQVPPEPTIRNPISHGWYVTAIEDRAHNVTTIAYKAYDATGQAGTPLGGSIDYIEDCFHRRITFSYGVEDPVPGAAFLLHQISQATGETTSRWETFSYDQAEATNSCESRIWPILSGVEDPASLKTLYTYKDPLAPEGTFRPYLLSIHYPTGAVSTYEIGQYRFKKLRFWTRHRVEEPLLQEGTGWGVLSHTVKSRPEVGASDNQLTWVWKRSIFARLCLMSLDSSYDFPVHPLVTVDPLGTEEVHYFSADDDPASDLPPGMEILTTRRRPGAPALDPLVLNNPPDNLPPIDIWDQVVSWTHKRYESGDYLWSGNYRGDTHRCYDVGWPEPYGMLARFGNIRPYDVIQAERGLGGAELWKKESLSTSWDGFGEYRRTEVKDLSPQPSAQTHYNGFVYAYPEEIPAFSPSGWTDLPLKYQTDLKTSSYSGAFAGSGQGYQHRVVQFTRDADTGLVTGQRFLRNVQTNPTSPTTSGSDKILAITYTNTLTPDGTTNRGNISTLLYSGGDSTATYQFDFAWDHGMVSQMLRAGSPYGVEFTRAIDPFVSRIVSNTDPNSLVTSFAFDDLDRLTSITPPGGEYHTVIAYPYDATTAEGETWTTSHDILFYRGPETFTPAVTDDLSGIDAGAFYQHYLFDDLGRLVKTRSLHPADSNDPGGYLTETLTSYDPLGRAFFTSLPYRVLAPPPADALNWTSRLTQTGDQFLTPMLRNPAEQSHISPYGSVTTFYSEAVWPSEQNNSLTQLIAGPAELFDRPVLSFRPDGTHTKTAYSGLDTATTVFGIKTAETYNLETPTTTWYRKDIWGRLTRVEPPIGTKAKYTYNALDQFIGVELKENLESPTVGQVRTFTYDALGRILSAHNPENGTTSYLGYDCIGNLLAVQDANGLAASPAYKLVNEYDALGRRTVTKKVNASTGALIQTLLENTYDALLDPESNPAANYDLGPALGKLVQSKSHQDLFDQLDEHGQEQYRAVETSERLSYASGTGRVGSVTQSTEAGGDGEEHTLTLTYDPYGQVASQDLPGGHLPTNVYSHGAMVQRWVSGNPVLSELQYDETGALTVVIFDTGDNQRTELDAYKRPKGFAFKDPKDAVAWGNGSFQNTSEPYRYDGAGNIASIGVSATQSDTFIYDELSRLKGADVFRKGAAEHKYSYTCDAFGNLTSRTEIVPNGFQPSTLNAYFTTQLGIETGEAEEYIKETVFSASIHETDQAKDNKLGTVTRANGTELQVEPQPVTYIYDANGNLINDGVYIYGYDALNRQVQLRDAGTNDLIADYAYLSSGERVAAVKYEGFTPVDYSRYFRDGATVVWELTDSVGHAKSYAYANGRMAFTHEVWTECLLHPYLLGASAPTLGTPMVMALAGSETATAEFSLSSLPTDAEAVEIRLVKGNALVANQRFDRPVGGWCGQERAIFAGLAEGADYQAGLTVLVREGRARLLPPKAYMVERMKLGLVKGRLAAWTVARYREAGEVLREESTAGFASLAPGGTEDYTANAKKGTVMEEIARGQEVEGVALPADATGLSFQGTAGGGLTLGSATLGLAKGGGDDTLPRCADYALRTYYGVDHLGTVRYTRSLDLFGNVVATNTHDYEPFGVEMPGKDSSGNTHQFTGHERDTETGNDYMHFRMFASSTGRFMKPDSQYDDAEANPQGYNLYTYVKENPVNRNDPTGHWGGDFHEAMASVALLAAGFSQEAAAAAAAANSGVDKGATDPFSSPDNRMTYHAFRMKGEPPEQTRARVLSNNCISEGMSPVQFGRESHTRQDAFSHNAYWATVGHLFGPNADSTTRHASEAESAFEDTLEQASKLDSSREVSSEKSLAAKDLMALIICGKVAVTEENGRVALRFRWFTRKADKAKANKCFQVLLSSPEPQPPSSQSGCKGSSP